MSTEDLSPCGDHDPTEPPPEDVEVSLLFCDVVRSTELTRRLGDRGAYRVIQDFHNLVLRAAAPFAGQELELRGDGVLLAFADPHPPARGPVVRGRVLAGDALEPAERELTVLFVDIRGYTEIAERLVAEAVFAALNEHTERVSRIVQENGGTIVEFNGDGMMAVFGAPNPLPKKEQAAVEAARMIVDSMPAHLAVGVGVATGPAFVGSIRSTDRLIWSAVGSTTNLAARLQRLTRNLGATVALDEATRERAGYVCADFVRHPNLAIRGRTGRFNVFALPVP